MILCLKLWERIEEVKFYSWNVEFLRHVYVEHIRRIQFEPQMAEEIFV